MAKEKHKSNREQWAWYFYDFGNSAYAAVVLLAIYSAYFQGEVVGGAEGTRLWGIAIGIAMLVVAVVAPILGTIADYSGKKKPLLLAMTGLSIIFTALLFFVEKGSVFTGMLFFILAEIGYRGGQVFYNAFLPEIATQKELTAVSGKGWAVGSVGGIICLVIVLGLILSFEGTYVVRLSFIITAIFYALSTIPLILWIKEKAQPQALEAGDNYFSLAIRKLKENFKTVKEYKQFLRFMLAYLIYNDGILAAMDFAAILGAVLFGMEQQQLIIFMIIVQVFSVAGAYIYAIIGERIGLKRSLIQSILLMIAAVMGIYFNSGLTGFFIIGAVAGFALTGVQSISRTMIGAFAPPGRSGEFFGFFGMVGRTSSFIGPFLFGIVAKELVDYYSIKGFVMGEAEILGHQQAIISIVVFLVIGLILLLRVNEEEGRKLALSGNTKTTGE